jgi:hypothetical protein
MIEKLQPEFTCNLTGKTYYNIENVIHEIECTLFGLIYVGETEQPLRTRMNGHLYNHSLVIAIDSERWAKTKCYYNMHDFNRPIVNCPLICSNISATHAYRVNISQVIFQSLFFSVMLSLMEGCR